jgi:hypothetical protein
MIDLKKFEKKKTTKPIDQLTPADIGSLVKIITIDGCEITDILVTFIAGEYYRQRGPGSSGVHLSLAHVGQYRERDYDRGGVEIALGMRVVVQRPLPEE